MRTGKLLAILGLITSTFLIFIRAMNPTTVQFIIEGNVVELNRVPDIYNSTDMAVTGVSCFILGSSLIYLLLVDKTKLNQNEDSLIRRDWSGLLESLSNPDERAIVKLIIDDGGTVFQSQLVEKSGYSKSKVSLILDRLEAKRILERKRRGMTNAVVLK